MSKLTNIFNFCYNWNTSLRDMVFLQLMKIEGTKQSPSIASTNKIASVGTLCQRRQLMSRNDVRRGKIMAKAFKFGDDISTDHIAPGRLFHLRSDLQEFAKHVLEDADPNFASSMQKGDFVVAGNNFGLGSSREHAPQIIKISGVQAVLAKSFARIFYRNAINIGLLAIECDTDLIDAGDELELDVKNGSIKNLTKSIEIKFAPLPDVMIKLLADGGLVEHVKKYGDFNLA